MTQETKSKKRGLNLTNTEAFSLNPSRQFPAETTNTLSESLDTVSVLEEKIADLTTQIVTLQAEKKQAADQVAAKGTQFNLEQDAKQAEITTKNRQIEELKLKLAAAKGFVKWPNTFKKLSEISPDAVDFFEHIILEIEKRYGPDAFEKGAMHPDKVQDIVWQTFFENGTAPFNQLQIYDHITTAIVDNVANAENSQRILNQVEAKRKSIGLPSLETKEQKILLSKPHTINLAQKVLALYEPIYRMLLYLYSGNFLGHLAIWMTADGTEPIDISERFSDVVQVFADQSVTPTSA